MTTREERQKLAESLLEMKEIIDMSFMTTTPMSDTARFAIRSLISQHYFTILRMYRDNDEEE